MGYHCKKGVRGVAAIAAALIIALSPSAAAHGDQPYVRQTAEQTPAPATRQTIEVKKYIFSGQDLVTIEELTLLLQDYVNKEATLSDLEKQADIITKYFRSKGYFVALAYIPPQAFQDGAVEIAVKPGRYDEVIIKNTTKLHDDAIRRELSNVKSGAVIERTALERALFLIGDLAGAEAKTSLQAGSKPGTTTLTVNVTPKGKQDWGYVGFDNSGYKYTGTYRYSAMWGHANFAREGDVFALDAANTTTGGSWSANVSYVIPVFTQGLKLGLSYNRSYYALGAPFTDLGATGTARTTSAYLEKNIKRTRNANWYAQIRFDHKKLSDTIVDEPANKSAHNWVFGIRGNTLDTWLGGGSNTYFLTYTRGNLGLYDLYDQVIDDLFYRRAGHFGKYNFGMTRLQHVNDRVDLYLSYIYQYPEKNLDASEKMSLGGPFAVRAYPIGEASGDQGWLSTVELRYNIPHKEGDKNTWQLIAFLDGGSVMINKNPPGSAVGNKRSLYGAGLGVNWSHVNNFAARVHYAFKLGSERALSDTDKSGRLWYQFYKFF